MAIVLLKNELKIEVVFLLVLREAMQGKHVLGKFKFENPINIVDMAMKKIMFVLFHFQ